MKYVSGYQGNFNPSQEAAIADGDTESAVISCGGFSLCGVKLPADFTGTALTFLMSEASDGDFVPVNGIDGDPIEYTVAQGNYYAIDPKDFQGINFLKLVSGTAEDADRVVICSLKGI